MKRRPIELICVVTFTLGTLMSFTWSEVSRNANVNRNSNATANQAVNAAASKPEEARADSLARLDCNANSIGQRKIDVEDFLEVKIPAIGYSSLEWVVNIVDAGTPNPADDFLEVLIEGRIKKRDRMNKLEHVFDDVMQPKCVERVIFVNPNTIPPSGPAIRAAPGFVWGCQFPERMCENGECSESCAS